MSSSLNKSPSVSDSIVDDDGDDPMSSFYDDQDVIDNQYDTDGNTSDRDNDDDEEDGMFGLLLKDEDTESQRRYWLCW